MTATNAHDEQPRPTRPYYWVRIHFRNSGGIITTASWDKPRWQYDGRWIARWIEEPGYGPELCGEVDWSEVVGVEAQLKFPPFSERG